MKVVEPGSAGEAVTCLLAAEDALILAGGTAVGVMLRQGLIDPEMLVSLRRLERRTPTLTETELRIDALSSLESIARDGRVRAVFPSLAGACGAVGNVRVRNAATVGGNVAEADYASDPPAVLISLDAVCEIAGPNGIREEAVRDVIAGHYTTSLQPGELIVGLRVPRRRGQRTSYRKFKSRSAEDRPCVGVAVAAEIVDDVVERLAVVVGATSATPERHDEVTRQYLGGPLTDRGRREVARAYAELIDPVDDERGTSWYRKRMIDVHVRRALEDIST